MDTTITTAVADTAMIIDPSMQSSASQWIFIVCFTVITIQMLRISIDLIQYVSILASQTTPTTPPTTATSSSSLPGDGLVVMQRGTSNGNNSSNTSNSNHQSQPTKFTNYGSTSTSTSTSTASNDTNTTTMAPISTLMNENKKNETHDEETMNQPLLPFANTINAITTEQSWKDYMSLICITIWSSMAIIYILLPHHNTTLILVYPTELLDTTSITLVLEIVLYIMDPQRQRYGIIQRTFHLLVPLLLWIPYAMMDLNPTTTSPSSSSSWVNLGLLLLTTWYVVFTMIFGYVTKHYIQNTSGSVNHHHLNKVDSEDGEDLKRISTKATTNKKKLSWSAIAILVKPYIWPDAIMVGDHTNAWWETSMNRFRAVATWVCVIISKYCSLISPLYLGWASTALAHQDYANCIRYTIWYNIISWLSSTFKEGQSLMYLKVKQAAFIQLSQTAFGHLHTLSLDWHLRKKLGEVLRSMDRGISACDTLMNYLFLWLVPAIAECIIVCIIFATYFKYLPLGVTVFYFVFVYVVWTIVLTVWRKKFRKALVFHDNEWHDRFTDSMINFETVKFFTAEQYEMERFANAVRKYQAGSVDVQSSLSMLNISQQVILKTCLATALSLTAIGIQKRIDCCVETMGCDNGISECCLSVSQKVCPGSKLIFRRFW